MSRNRYALNGLIVVLPHGLSSVAMKGWVSLRRCGRCNLIDHTLEPKEYCMSRSNLTSTIHDFLRTTAEPTPAGGRRPYFDSQTATLGRLACHVTTLSPGKSAHLPHRHPEEELICVKEGTLEARLNESTHQLSAGSVFFIAPNDLHGVTNVGTREATYFVIRIWSEKTGKPAQ